MASNETVKLNIVIEISCEELCDTGLTVAEWNALTDEGRYRIYEQQWDAMAESNGGGVRVVTEGAEGV